MTIKSIYQMPQIQVIAAEDNDILTTSGFEGEEHPMGPGSEE